MPRVTFNSVFKEHKDGSIETTQAIRVAGITYEPGVRFNKGNLIGGIDFTQYKGRDLQINIDKDILVIIGIY